VFKQHFTIAGTSNTEPDGPRRYTSKRGNLVGTITMKWCRDNHAQ